MFAILLCCALISASPSAASAAQSVAQPTAAAPASPLGLKAYEAQLDSYAAQISKDRRQPAALARLRESIPAQWDVRAGQTGVSVSSDWLTTALADLASNQKEADARARAIDARLAAMSQAAAQLEAPSSSPTDARAHLDAIFHRTEFKGLHGPTALEILEMRIGRWIGDLILSILMHLHLGAKVGNIFGWVVIGIAFGFLCWWLWKRLAVLGPAAEARPGAAAPQITSRQWLDEALAAADRGEFREAVHCAYWAAIARLEDSGRLSRDRARTPREALRQLGAQAFERETLANLTGSFERVWYGQRPASAAEWLGARAQLEDMGCLKRSTVATVTS